MRGPCRSVLVVVANGQPAAGLNLNRTQGDSEVFVQAVGRLVDAELMKTETWKGIKQPTWLLALPKETSPSNFVVAKRKASMNSQNTSMYT